MWQLDKSNHDKKLKSFALFLGKKRVVIFLEKERWISRWHTLMPVWQVPISLTGRPRHPMGQQRQPHKPIKFLKGWLISSSCVEKISFTKSTPLLGTKLTFAIFCLHVVENVPSTHIIQQMLTIFTHQVGFFNLKFENMRLHNIIDFFQTLLRLLLPYPMPQFILPLQVEPQPILQKVHFTCNKISQLLTKRFILWITVTSQQITSLVIGHWQPIILVRFLIYIDFPWERMQSNQVQSHWQINPTYYL